MSKPEEKHCHIYLQDNSESKHVKNACCKNNFSSFSLTSISCGDPLLDKPTQWINCCQTGRKAFQTVDCRLWFLGKLSSAEKSKQHKISFSLWSHCSLEMQFK